MKLANEETVCMDEDCEEKEEEEKLQTTVDMKTEKVKHNTSDATFVVPSAKLTDTIIIVKPTTQTKNIIPFEINDNMKINNKIFKFPSNAFECKSSCKTAASSYTKCINSRLVHFNKNYLLQTGIDQLCYYINESILPKPGFEDSEDHLIPRAMTHAAEELKKCYVNNS